MSDWIVKITSANMPASCRSNYKVVRVLEVLDGVTDVTSVRAKQVVSVVYESCAVPAGGTTERSRLQQALSHARGLIARRVDIAAQARAATVANAKRRAEIAQRKHDETLESRRAHQDMIAAKLERGERLTESEFARL